MAGNQLQQLNGQIKIEFSIKIQVEEGGARTLITTMQVGDKVRTQNLCRDTMNYYLSYRFELMRKN